jgi:membrane associated rhomboid family serine protease
MRSRYPSSSTLAYSFGPGPLTSAIKAIVIANVVAFVASLVFPAITRIFGLQPADIFGHLYLWQPVTYMFLHAGIFHICSTCSRYGCSAWNWSGCGAAGSS